MFWLIKIYNNWMWKNLYICNSEIIRASRHQNFSSLLHTITHFWDKQGLQLHSSSDFPHTEHWGQYEWKQLRQSWPLHFIVPCRATSLHASPTACNLSCRPPYPFLIAQYLSPYPCRIPCRAAPTAIGLSTYNTVVCGARRE